MKITDIPPEAINNMFQNLSYEEKKKAMESVPIRLRAKTYVKYLSLNDIGLILEECNKIDDSDHKKLKRHLIRNMKKHNRFNKCFQ